MATTLEIINGISQVLAKGYDGALDENDEPVKIGLKREEGDPLIDSRVVDGFGVKFEGNKICITYSSEIKLKEVYGGSLEDDVSSKISDIAKFLKKEYKSLTKTGLSLTASGDVECFVQPLSRVRTLVTAKQRFDIGGVKSESIDQSERPEVDIPTTPEAKKSQNDDRKADPFDVFKAYDFSNRRR